MNGVLLIDKASGMSSFDVLRQLKKRFQTAKMGHLGTLDPLATGLLVVFVGSATKLIPYFSELDKRYLVDGELGKSSDTYDGTGKITDTAAKTLPSEDDFLIALEQFIGPQWQIQPPFSALKFQGKRAYEHAREGKKIYLGKRQVTISTLEAKAITLPKFTLLVHCSSGTYIRSFIHELGEHLKTGAIMTALRRVAVGPFKIDQAASLTDINHQDCISTTEIIDHFIDDAQLPAGEKDYLKRKFQGM